MKIGNKTCQLKVYCFYCELIYFLPCITLNSTHNCDKIDVSRLDSENTKSTRENIVWVNECLDGLVFVIL